MYVHSTLGASRNHTLEMGGDKSTTTTVYLQQTLKVQGGLYVMLSQSVVYTTLQIQTNVTADNERQTAITKERQ